MENNGRNSQWTSKTMLSFFFLSFLIWILCFKGFLMNRLTLSSDAIAYFEHFKYYLDQIARGVYPLWDPNRELGTPIEFFLRRIGSFNPLIFLMLLVSKLGLPFIFAYLWFLAFYYFFGLIGFYLLAELIFRNKVQAFSAYLLLMFSSLGTRLFDSYFLLTMVPMAWFFYFLVAFARNRQKHEIVGLALSLMILMTTYIPFYFITIIFSFIFFYVLLYSADAIKILKSWFAFFNMHKLISCFCLLSVLISLIPGVLFFKEADKGEVVFPKRHYTSQAENTLEVEYETITQWGIEEDILYSKEFTDFRKFKFAILYIPVFAYLVLGVGLLTAPTRRLIFFFFWGMTFFLSFCYHAPIYAFLYDHVFYFKYFRNLHFFLWMILLPILILFIVDQLGIWIRKISGTGSKKWQETAWVIIVHGVYLLAVLRQEDAVASTYLSVGISLLFFISIIFLGSLRSISLGLLLLACVTAQPIEVYHYLQRNSDLVDRQGYRYMRGNYVQLTLPETDTPQAFVAPDSLLKMIKTQAVSTQYLGTKWTEFLFSNLDYELVCRNDSFKFLVYDHVTRFDEGKGDLLTLTNLYANFPNSALIPADAPASPLETQVLDAGDRHALVVTKATRELRVTDFDVNSVQLKSAFDHTKFLVYNDAYHSGWRAYIDGKKVELFRANFAFKGVLVPAGEHKIEFRFGAPWRYWLYFFLIILCQGMFISIIFMALNSSNGGRPLGRAEPL